MPPEFPELPPSVRPWYILAPWKYHRPWARLIGFYCLTCILVSVTATVVDVGWFWKFVVTPLYLGLLVLMIIDFIRMRGETRKYKHVQRVMQLWAQVIDGSTRIEDLPPAIQEDIAAERAKVYTWQRPVREDDE